MADEYGWTPGARYDVVEDKNAYSTEHGVAGTADAIAEGYRLETQIFDDIHALARAINARGKFVATVDNGVMRVVTSLKAHACPTCHGTGKVAEVGEVVAETVILDVEHQTVMAGSGASMAAGAAAAWFRSLHR